MAHNGHKPYTALVSATATGGRALRPARYRPAYHVFNVLNSFSFMLLSGSIPALLALSMGASGTYIGVLGSLNFVTFFLMPLGRYAIRRFRIVSVFGWAWMGRYLGMLPAVAAPFLARAGQPLAGLGVLMAGSAVFNVCKGVGLIGNNPVLAFMAGSGRRGAFLSTVQISSSLTSIATGVATAFIMAHVDGGMAYWPLLALGVVTGVAASVMLLRMPEPEAFQPPSGSSLGASMKEAFADQGFKRFMWVLAALSFASGTARTFILTHARDLYLQNDGQVLLFSVATSLGSVGMGFLSKRMMDRLGAKPMYAAFSAVSALALVPVALSPALDQGSRLFVFLAAVNFLAGFGLAGQENAAQVYFFSMVKPQHMVDLAVVYYLIFGLGGALGSTLGGVALDAMACAGVPLAISYRVLYGTLIVIVTLATLAIGALQSLGSAGILESVGVLFSVRDFRSVGLLERLGRSHSPNEETRVIREIGTRGSPLAERELLPYLASPRFDVRVEALLALENLQRLSPKALEALRMEAREREWSTAYLAARVLGKRGYAPAVPELRAALDSADYMLKGAAVIALARLGDADSLDTIERMAEETTNPRLLISAAAALEIYRAPGSVPSLVAALKRSNPPPFAFDEIVLALAGLLGGLGDFYRIYSSRARDPADALAELLDSLPAERDASNELHLAAENFVLRGQGGPAIARALAAHPWLEPGAAAVLEEAALDPELSAHDGFRMLLAACAIEGARGERRRSARHKGGAL